MEGLVETHVVNNVPFCRLLKRLDFHELKFSLYFMGYESAEDIPKDEKQRTMWLLSKKGTIELTQ